MKIVLRCPLCDKLTVIEGRKEFLELVPYLACRQCDDRPAEVRYVDALRRRALCHS